MTGCLTNHWSKSHALIINTSPCVVTDPRRHATLSNVPDVYYMCGHLGVLHM